jgi:hypothetical protein
MWTKTLFCPESKVFENWRLGLARIRVGQRQMISPQAAISAM